MGRGRKTKLKVPIAEFVKYMLDKLVDKNGNKMSIRDIWKDEAFIKWSGMNHSKAKDGEFIPVSEGTMSYHCLKKSYYIPQLSEKYNGRKFNLGEDTLFSYHKYISQRIPYEVTFNEFSREKNRGYGKITNYSGDKNMSTLSILNRIAEELGCPLGIKEFGNITEYREHLQCRYILDFEEAQKKVIEQYG